MGWGVGEMSLGEDITKCLKILIVTTDSLHYTDPERAEDRKPPNDLEKGLGLLKLFAGIPNLGDG